MRTLQVALCVMALALCVPACGGDDTGGGTTNVADTTATDDTATDGTNADGSTGDDDTSTEEVDGAESGPDTTPEPEPCVPACDGKDCGDDGCEGSCGTCTAPATCSNSTCCSPDCTDKTCGNDGCGGSCGDCGAAEQCTAGVCEPKTYTCSEMFSAAQAADCDWSADFAGCQTSITDTWQASDETEGESLAALLACLDETGCSVTQSQAQVSCQKDDCLAETASCEASQNGTLMCFEITQCLQEATCPKDLTTGAPTAACRRQCLEQGSATAVSFWLNLELCGVVECLGEADYDQCVTDVSSLQCVTEYSDCYDEAQQ